MLYTIIIFLIAAMAVVWGFRRGFARQTPAVIGVAFGIVSARLLAPGLLGVLDGAFPSVHGRVEAAFVYFTLATTLVFFSIYLIFRTITGFLGNVLKRDDRSILDNLGGAAFALFRYMLFVSIAYNMLLALHTDPTSDLVRCARADDGNIVLETMLLSPSLLGGPDVADLHLQLQYEAAKKIS